MGQPPKTIRYSEDIGLLTADRTAKCRDYHGEDVHRFRFVREPAASDFRSKNVRQYLSLYTDRDRASADVKAITT